MTGPRGSLTRAWAALVVLSALSTLASLRGVGGGAAVLAVLVLAWAKARIILNRYLRLAQAPAIARGFALSLALFMALLAGLALWPLT